MARGDEAVPAAHLAGRALPWWESRLCIVLIVIATMLPLIYPKLPPLVDLLGHMGRYRVELDLNSSPPLQRYYGFHWVAIGNLGVDTLVLLLAPLFDLEFAVKLIVLAIPPITAIGMLWVGREVHGRLPPTAFFALPFIYGFPFLFGFVNFTLSVALAFVGFGLWLHLGRLGRTTLRGLLFVPISILIYFCHVYGWALLGLICISAEAVRLHDDGRSWQRASLVAAQRTSVMALPLLMMLAWRDETHAGSTDHWFDFSAKLQWILSALRDRWRRFDLACVVVALIVMIEARRRDSLVFSRSLVIPALLLTLVFLLLPLTIAGSAFADMRFVPYMFALGLLAIGMRGDEKVLRANVLAAAALAFLAVRIAATTASFAISARDAEARLLAIDAIPRGARVATLVGVSCTFDWALPRGTHLGSMVIVRRDGFSNDQWIIQGINLLDVRYRSVGRFKADPSELVHARGCRDSIAPWSLDDALRDLPRPAFDYLWLIDPPPFDPILTRGMERVWSGRHSVLYRIHPTASAG